MIKKTILMLLVLVGGVMTVQADNVKIYLKPGTNWSQDNAIFKLYYFNNTTNNWSDFIAVEGHDGYYVAEVDADTYTTMIIVRMDPGNTDQTYWERKWNQSWDLTIPTENSIYYIADTAWDGENFSYTSEELKYKVFYSINNDANGTVADMAATEKPYVFTYTFDNQTTTIGYYFMIMSTSNVGDNNDIIDWNKIYFPEKVAQSDEIHNPKVLTFANNQNGNIVNQSWTRWKLDDNAAVKYVVTFDRIGATWSVEPYFERTLNAAAEGYATFSSTYDVLVPTGLTAKYASAVVGGKITWEEFGANGIPAGQGALLEGSAGENYKFTPATSAEAPSVNSSVNFMKAINEKIQLPQTEDGNTNYILTKSTVNGEAALGFYKVNVEGSWCAAGTAYLSVPSQQAPEFIVLGETTGIANVNRENVSDNQYYMLDGRRVAQPTKGLYIVNGKKVIIK